MYLNTSVFTSFLEKEWVTLIVFKLYFSHEINCRKRILICAQTSIKFSIILGVLLTETCFIPRFTISKSYTIKFCTISGVLLTEAQY